MVTAPCTVDNSAQFVHGFQQSLLRDQRWIHKFWSHITLTWSFCPKMWSFCPKMCSSTRYPSPITKDHPNFKWDWRIWWRVSTLTRKLLKGKCLEMDIISFLIAMWQSISTPIEVFFSIEVFFIEKEQRQYYKQFTEKRIFLSTMYIIVDIEF